MTNKSIEGADFLQEDEPNSLMINWAAVDMIKYKYLGTKEFVVDEQTIQELIDNLIYVISSLEMIRKDKYTLTHINHTTKKH